MFRRVAGACGEDRCPCAVCRAAKAKVSAMLLCVHMAYVRRRICIPCVRHCISESQAGRWRKRMALGTRGGNTSQ